MPLNNLTGNKKPNNNSDSNNGGFPNIQVSLADNDDAALDLLINYNQMYKTAGTILFRDNCIRQTLSTLICKNKPNALFIGSAGVGKTKICEDIAYRLANDDALIPDKLKGYTLYELPISNIISGSSLVGQLEQKLQNIIEFVRDPKNKAILFIDEIHQITSANDHYMKIAQILKPALARGDFHCIGATYPALNRLSMKWEKTFKQDKIFIGHFHSCVSIPNAMVNGSIIGYNSYSLTNGFSYEEPAQMYELVDTNIGEILT